MPYPQIELWLYDTRQELDRDAKEGKVCPWSAVRGLSCRYPTPWVIEQRQSLRCTVAYTVFMGQKYPDWPELLCCAIQDLSSVTRRWMLVPDNFSPNPAETILGGHCLCFAVDVPAHSITITQDDDARAEFCQALENYSEDLHIPQDGFPF